MTEEFFPNLKIFGVSPVDPGHIYLIQHGNRFKIGKSKNITARMKAAKTWLPYVTKRALKGVVIVQPDKKKEDIFDLPPQELRNLIRGFVWRDAHFQGETLEQIAAREGFSDAFVGRLIRQTFEIA